MRQDPISWDKLLELPVAPVNQVLVLVLVLDLCHLTIGAPPDFITTTVHLLWMKHEAKVLTGKLNHIAFGVPWLEFVLGNICPLLPAALCLSNSHSSRPAHPSVRPSM